MAKLFFGGVHVDHDVDRMGGAGLAYAHTSYFRTESTGAKPQRYTIELDTATGLVTVSTVVNEKYSAVIFPRERVKRFEPLPESTPAAK